MANPAPPKMGPEWDCRTRVMISGFGLLTMEPMILMPCRFRRGSLFFLLLPDNLADEVGYRFSVVILR